jgi:integrase
MPKLTVKALEALAAHDSGRRISDGESLYGVVRATIESVSVLFRWRYRFNGQLKDFTCGTWPAASLATIRKNRDDAERLTSEGKDPAEEGRAQKLRRQAEQAEAIAREHARISAAEALRARMTVKQLFERWENLELSARKDKGAEVRRSFEKDGFPAIGEVAAEDVRRTMVASILDKVVARGARIVARNLLGDIRQMYGFAIVRGLVDHDPTSHMKRDDFGKKVERDRVLSEDEIKELRDNLPNAGLQKSTELAIWLMLSTCCRVGELTQARWKDVDLERRVLRIPPEHTKNGKAHIVFLSEFAVQQFKALQLFNSETDWCFPAENGKDHVDLKSIAKQVRDRQRTTAMKNRSKATATLLLSGGRWTPHDFRRSGATLMGNLGVRPDVIEKCLNHIEQNKMLRIYQRQELRAEQKQAWLLLGQRLSLLIRDGAKNVVTLRPINSAQTRLPHEHIVPESDRSLVGVGQEPGVLGRDRDIVRH